MNWKYESGGEGEALDHFLVRVQHPPLPEQHDRVYSHREMSEQNLKDTGG